MNEEATELVKEDNDLAWFIGFSLGDGYSTYGRYGIDTTSPEIVGTLLENLRKMTQIPVKAEVYGNRERFCLDGVKTHYYLKRKDVHSDHIKIKVDSVSFASGIRKIEEEIIRNCESLPETTKCKILSGFFDAEGTVSPNGILEIDLSPKSVELAGFVNGLLKGAGIRCKLFHNPRRIRVVVCGGMKDVGNLSLFQEKVGFRIQRKKEELKDMIAVYSLPVDKRTKTEIGLLLEEYLRREGHAELKRCMKDLHVKITILKKCANQLTESGAIEQYINRKRVCLRLVK